MFRSTRSVATGKFERPFTSPAVPASLAAPNFRENGRHMRVCARLEHQQQRERTVAIVGTQYMAVHATLCWVTMSKSTAKYALCPELSTQLANEEAVGGA